jgi:hypothetical protein
MTNAKPEFGSSVLSQSGTGGTAEITLGGATTLPATGTATTGGGYNSQPVDLVASVYNTTAGSAGPVAETFQLQAEPVGNNSGA